jgi:hypothetical protein
VSKELSEPSLEAMESQDALFEAEFDSDQRNRLQLAFEHYRGLLTEA